MEMNKLISSLCYFSVFFAPFLFPIVVYFVADEPYMKKHAKASFLSHLLPAITFVLLLVIFIPGMPLSGDFIFGWFFIVMILFGLLSFIMMVWNVVRGIKVLMS